MLIDIAQQGETGEQHATITTAQPKVSEVPKIPVA